MAIELKSGMMGTTKNGQNFVIIDDYVLYEDGGWDNLTQSWFNDNQIKCGTQTIALIVDGCKSFNWFNFYLEYPNDECNKHIKVVYGSKETVMTIKEIEDKLGITNLRIKKEEE